MADSSPTPLKLDYTIEALLDEPAEIPIKVF
jgi:hypothetical protein